MSLSSMQALTVDLVLYTEVVSVHRPVVEPSVISMRLPLRLLKIPLLLRWLSRLRLLALLGLNPGESVDKKI